MKDILADPTFGVLIAFAIFCLLAGRHISRLVKKRTAEVKYRVTTEMKDADDLLQEAQENWESAKAQGRLIAENISKINLATQRQILHVKKEIEQEKKDWQKATEKKVQKYLRDQETILAKRLLQQGIQKLYTHTRANIRKTNETSTPFWNTTDLQFLWEEKK